MDVGVDAQDTMTQTVQQLRDMPWYVPVDTRAREEKTPSCPPSRRCTGATNGMSRSVELIATFDRLGHAHALIVGGFEHEYQFGVSTC